MITVRHLYREVPSVGPCRVIGWKSLCEEDLRVTSPAADGGEESTVACRKCWQVALRRPAGLPRSM